MLVPQIFLISVFTALALAGCAASQQTPEPASSGPLVPSLQVQTSGGSVQFVLQVTNTSSAAVPLEFSSSQSFDFAVVRDGREVWRWSADQMFTQALRNESIAPGATRTYTASWNPPAGMRGEFTASGMLTATNHPVGQRAIFQLP